MPSRTRTSRKASRQAVRPLYRQSDYERECDGPGVGFDRDEPWRTDFRRDYARFIHCAAFRRLVGKTQLFAGHESDFFRNRLTHSLEVAQVAKSIAIKLNATQQFFRMHGRLDTDLIEVAGLAHDLGHPPFGHNGESALDYCMRDHGGFEGNAQTLRILARLEKKITKDILQEGIEVSGKDDRFGLDLCARTLASVLKYDSQIPLTRTKEKNDKVAKGYYQSEGELVRFIKESVGSVPNVPFKTIECQIMDISDDIAYSTYDLEDSFKAGFLSPIDVLTAETDVYEKIADEVKSSALKERRVGYATWSTRHVFGVLLDVFGKVFDDDSLPSAGSTISEDDLVKFALRRYKDGKRVAQNGYLRTSTTADLVGQFIAGVEFAPRDNAPALSIAKLNDKTWQKVEVLKHFTFASLIMSPRLKLAEQRGKEIVTAIFDQLSEEGGHYLLPADCRLWYERVKTKTEKMRVICDFIAGMTDRYAAEFYSRLKSEHPQSFFKPH